MQIGMKFGYRVTLLSRHSGGHSTRTALLPKVLCLIRRYWPGSLSVFGGMMACRDGKAVWVDGTVLKAIYSGRWDLVPCRPRIQPVACSYIVRVFIWLWRRK